MEQAQKQGSENTNLPSTGGKPGRIQVGNLLLTLPFIAIFLVQLAHHRMWRDELNAFGIAAASPNLSTLFHYIHYEGHPWLWYVLMWCISQFTADPTRIKILQAVVGIGIYLVIGLSSPFSRVEKLLLFCCYFVSFEYTVMTRMYGLMFLLLLLYLRERVQRPDRLLTAAALLGLMACTDVMGIFLATALVCERIYTKYTLPRNQSAARNTRINQWTYIAGGIVGLSLLAFSAFSLKLTSDIGWRLTGTFFKVATDPLHLLDTAICYIVMPYFPVRNPFAHNFWIPDPYRHRLFYVVCLPVVLGIYWSIFRRNRNLLLLLALTLLACVSFGHLIYLGAMRHYGTTFLAFLSALWLLKAQQPRLPIGAHILLGLTVFGGLIAGVETWLRPFSNAQPAAAWIASQIAANRLEPLPLVGTPDTSVVGIAEVLHRPIYMLDCQCQDTFLLYSKRRNNFDVAEIPSRMADAQKFLAVPSYLYIAVYPLTNQEQAEMATKGLAATSLANFTGAEVADENFYLYKVTQTNAPSAVMQKKDTSHPGPPPHVAG